MNLTRRQILKTAGMTLSAGLYPKIAFGNTRGESDDPHYFLEVLFRPGWDPTYLCDARPLAMTAAGKLQNYLGQEPTLLTGSNGGQTLVTSLFAPLRPHFDAGRLSILNGVHMASTFDGHEQNLNFLFTGNPFGGKSFVPYLANVGRVLPVDYLQVGLLFGTVLDNVGNGISIFPFSAKNLTAAARVAGPVDLGSSALRYLESRLMANGGGAGRFSTGTQQMHGGMSKTPELSEKIRAVDLSDIPDNDQSLDSILKVSAQYLMRGITRNIVLEMDDHNLDTHDATSAQAQPEVYPRVVADIVKIIDFLLATPAGDNSGRSLFDLTTVVITSEFGRTMRQQGSPVDATGTDHNPLNNTVLLAGKAVRGGQIIGASDQEAVDAPISGAHRTLDMFQLKMMGKPFDFSTSMPLPTLPDVYVADNYLSYASIANSLMKLYGVSDDKLWSLTRDGPAAQLLGAGILG